MGMWLARGVLGTMLMPMMFIVHMRMRVRDRFVIMLVPVKLGEMQPDADCHQHPSDKELSGDLFAERGH
jgi:hypothetical protein